MAAHPTDISAGELLRRARARRRISVEQAAWDTRISSEYLQALEDDTPLTAFPAPVYAKYFLREYATYLGLPPDGTVEFFSRAHVPVRPSGATALPKKYALLGEEATRGPVGISPGREAPLPAALRPRRRSVLAPPVAAFETERPQLRMDMPTHSRPRSIAIAGLLALSVPAIALGVAFGHGRTAIEPRAAVADPRGSAQLPLGGTRIFPHYRVVALYGAPGTDRLGILGIGPEAAAAKLLVKAHTYAKGRKPVLPAFELIATVASSHPGDGGLYRIRQNPAVIQQYLDTARDLKALLVLDIQPGRADFLSEVKALEPFLRMPDVGLALDPEWHVGPGAVPGQVLGSVDAATVNSVIRYLSGLVEQNGLPEKLLIVHQFTSHMVEQRGMVRPTPQVAVTFDVDGVGGQDGKTAKYLEFASDPRFHYGIKLYLHQDVDLMKPLDVINLYPSPDLVVYQ